MPGFEDLLYLLDATPQQFADAACDFEQYLSGITGTGPIPGPAGLLMFVVLDRAAEKPFLPVYIPYSEEDVLRLSGTTRRRGQMGLFISGLARNMCMLPAEKIRQSAGDFHREGQSLLWTALYVDTVTAAHVPDYISDYEKDIPAEQQIDKRQLFCADGRGTLVMVTRNGETTEAVTMPCIPDVDHPIRYLHDMSIQPGISPRSSVPWGLATLAIGYRYVFEGKPLNDHVPA